MVTRDILWKGIIEDLFPYFLQYFYGDWLDQIDFTKGFEFLDKELEKLFPQSKAKHRYADKLIKVFTSEGTEQWILIHVEVQGYDDPSFAERMFTYYYRIFDRYKKPITALAIFTDDYPTYHPKYYESKCLGTSLQYHFRTTKLSEYSQEAFRDLNNPFSIVMEVAYWGLKKHRLNDEGLYSLKRRLFKNLLQAEYTREVIEKIARFITYYTRFENKEIFSKFEEAISKTNKKMGIVELIEQELIRQGKEEGIQLGFEKGIEQGREEGREEGEALKEYEFVCNLHEAGFDSITIAVSLKIPETRVLEILEKRMTLIEEEE